MIERDRNYLLMQLLIKLHKENDGNTIELLRTMVENDTPAMKKSFQIMTQNSPLATLFGLNTLSELDVKKETDPS